MSMWMYPKCLIAKPEIRLRALSRPAEESGHVFRRAEPLTSRDVMRVNNERRLRLLKRHRANLHF